MKISKRSIGKIVLEFLSVVFAVLLALGLNHWREKRVNQSLAEDSLDRIRAEMNDNRQEIDSTILQFAEVISHLSMQAKAIDSLGVTEISWGYSHPVLSSDSWTTATITNAVIHMDPDLVEDLADIYAVQEMYSEFGFKFFDRVAELARFRDEPDILIEILQSHYNISNSIAQSLQRGYEDFLAEHPEMKVE